MLADVLLPPVIEPVPPAVASSRALAELHRLDLALFVAFEEASLRLAGSLVRHAPGGAALAACARQAADDGRHLAAFRARLEQDLTAAAGDRAAGVETDLLRLLQGQPAARPGPLAPEELAAAVVIAPFRHFLQTCTDHADAGRVVETVTLLNLVLKGLAAPLYRHEVRYWQPVDPTLAALAQTAAEHECRHVGTGLELVAGLVRADPAQRAAVLDQFDEGRQAMREVSDYYIRRFVASFAAIARRQPELFARAEVAPGRRLADTPEAEQRALVTAAVEASHEGIRDHLRDL